MHNFVHWFGFPHACMDKVILNGYWYPLRRRRISIPGTDLRPYSIHLNQRGSESESQFNHVEKSCIQESKCRIHLRQWKVRLHLHVPLKVLFTPYRLRHRLRQIYNYVYGDGPFDASDGPFPLTTME